MTTILQGREAVDHVLARLKAVGLYDGTLDGKLGPLGQGGLERALAAYVNATTGHQIAPRADDPPLAWGARVSRVFRDRIHWMVEDLQMPKDEGANDLMSCIAWETGETFSPSVKNGAGSGATGLIQFMPETARALGTTTAALAAMTAEDQLNYVHKYFKPYRGRLKNLGDLYMAILWPAGVGKPDSFVLWDKATRPTTYRQNSGIDINKDGVITRAEAINKVMGKKARGLLPENYHK